MNLPLNTPFLNPSETDQARFNMIEQQIRPWDVHDNTVLDLLAVMRREAFVPGAYRALAFADMEIPLPGGQCMLSPKVEARTLQDLRLRPTDRVLEIGAGSGYMAALLARLAGEVVTLEIDPALAQLARENLRDAGIDNATVLHADGALPPRDAGAPFDAIVLSGSVAEVPDFLLQQLALGGRLSAVVGLQPVMRMHYFVRNSERDFQLSTPWDIVLPRLVHFPEPSRFHF